MPAAPEVYREEEIPQHPALQLIANSEQVLSTKFSRRLITMQKVGVPRVQCCSNSLPIATINERVTTSKQEILGKVFLFSSRTSSYATTLGNQEL